MSIMHAQSTIAASPAGAGPGLLNLTPIVIFEDVGGGGSAIASLTFVTDGSLSVGGNSSPIHPADEWWTANPDVGVGTDYEVAYTTLVSGTGPTSGLGLNVFGALSSSRTWSLSATDTVLTGIWTFRVREIATPANFVEANLNITVQVTP